ncbi:carbohydrate porin, partial [Synechococcus sp. AH-601-J22]|nr:carbohydrate porin [Synechococcus sp. AH-601-J22]
DENFAAEFWYQYQVTDNISIKPAVFWTQDANGNATVSGANKFGALVQTTFKF